MTVRDVVRLVVGRLEAAGADYVIVGAVAYFMYGISRFTKDADFVVALPPAVLNGVLAGLPPEFQIDPQTRMELFTGTMRWVVDIVGTELKAEFFLLGGDAHHQEEFRRRKRLWLSPVGIEAWVAPLRIS